MTMKRNPRIFALTLAILLLCAVIAAGALNAFEAGHDCPGVDCPVCAALAACVLRLFALPCLSCTAVLCIVRASKTAVAGSASGTPLSTLVSWKILLLN